MSKQYHLFISHSWTYSKAYDGLVELLNKDVSFNYVNYSVPKDDPIHNAGNDKELYDAIKSQISKSSVIIILAGVYSTYSKWINKEIQIAKKEFLFPKPIIAVVPRGAERISAVVKDSADRIVKWNSMSVISAIRDVA